MNKRNNSASRVHAILVRAQHIQAGKGEPSTVLDIWARVLKISAKEHYERERKVTTALALLQGEINQIESAMRIAEDPPDQELYRHPLAKAREIFSVQTLPHGWSQNLAPKITSEVIQAIGWCAREMPDDGELLTTEQVDQLLADVRELIAQFEASAIRPALKAFIIEHLRLIEQAIINYPVVGARPLIDTFTRVRRDLSERQEEIFQAEASTDDEVQNSLWWKLQDYGAKLYAMLAGLVKFEKLLKEGYDTYKGLLPPPSSQMPGSDDDIGGLPS